MNSKAVEGLKLSADFNLDDTFLEQFKNLPVVGPIKYKHDNSTYQG